MPKNPIADKAEIVPPSFPAFSSSIIATVILSLALGYWIGVGNSLLPFSFSKKSQRKRKSTFDKVSDSSDVSSSEDDKLSLSEQEFSNEEYKLVFRFQ
jgi:hypothetical protein